MKSKNNTLVLVLFLLGIFMGAIDTGIVSPAREIIQNSFGVPQNVGIWMVTIYTLTTAILMPIVSKLADSYGHKKVYAFGIAIFGLGSLLCGLANYYGNFGIFLAARVIQAAGSGGIMPIANTFIGLSFPEEKRGAALGFVGAIYGVATIIGPTVGSAILNISGNQNWGWIFFINIPMCIAILILSTAMKDTNDHVKKPLDFFGAIILAGVVGSIMYAFTNIDLYNLKESIRNTGVYPFLVAFLVLLPILVFVEKKVKDPILNIKYFTNRQMLITFILAFLVGVGTMGMLFVPQFVENVLKIKAGSGGYLATILVVFAGISAPICGKVIDKKGVRFVLIIGFFLTVTGTLVLGYVSTNNMDYISIIIGLVCMGIGVGFSMGAPLNYLVLQNAPKNEETTGLATMSLFCSLGIAVSPNLMIGFIADASRKLQPKLSEVLQQGAVSLDFMKDEKAQKLFSSIQSADVNTAVDKLKDIFKQLLPLQSQASAIEGIEKLRTGIENAFQSTVSAGYTHMFTATAIISLFGLFTAFLLKKKKSEQTVSENSNEAGYIADKQF